MPTAGDPNASVGYLIAAALATIGGLGTYAVLLVQRYRSALARNQQLKGDRR